MRRPDRFSGTPRGGDRGNTRQPDEAWMTQVARNLTDAGDGFLRGVHYLILNRDPLHTAAFRRLLRGTTSIGINPVRCRARIGGLLSSTTARPRRPISRVFADDG